MFLPLKCMKLDSTCRAKLSDSGLKGSRKALVRKCSGAQIVFLPLAARQGLGGWIWTPSLGNSSALVITRLAEQDKKAAGLLGKVRLALPAGALPILPRGNEGGTRT